MVSPVFRIADDDPKSEETGKREGGGGRNFLVTGGGNEKIEFYSADSVYENSRKFPAVIMEFICSGARMGYSHLNDYECSR